MIIFQWSAISRDGYFDLFLGIVRRWVHFNLLELGWPAGRILRCASENGSVTVEHHFDDMQAFERAWESLLNSEQAPGFWAELRPYLADDDIDRQLYSVTYARDRSR